jgi:F420H(2)-dependent quinone reductase
MKKLALDLADKMWPVIARFAAAHTAIYRRTNGRIGHRAPWLPTILLLDHVGARSGMARTTPLLYFRDGEAFVVVASKGGYSQHPAWYHNLLAHPDTTVQVRSRKLAVHARVAGPQELERLWPKALEVYPTYGSYRERTDREMPFVILEPVH